MFDEASQGVQIMIIVRIYGIIILELFLVDIPTL